MRHFKYRNLAWFQRNGSNQWFSDLNIRIPRRAFYNTNPWIPTSEFLIQSVWGWGPRIYISHKFPDDTGPHFEMHSSRWTPGFWGQAHLTLTAGSLEELPDTMWEEVTRKLPGIGAWVKSEAGIVRVKKRGRRIPGKGVVLCWLRREMFGLQCGWMEAEPAVMGSIYFTKSLDG